MIWFLGDVHGEFSHILSALQRAEEKPAAVVFLGDIQPSLPFEQILSPIEAFGVECWFIHGNHESDDPAEFSNLFDSPLFQERSLHGRVVEIAGVRIAGLGGVFRGQMWMPPAEPELLSYNEMEIALQAEFERGKRSAESLKGSLRKHRTSIFYEDWLSLHGQQADILVTHEAPSCHPHGFETIDVLAKSLGVQKAYHGHHHDRLDARYRLYDEKLGFQTFGVGLRGIADLAGAVILPGMIDERRMGRGGES